MRMLFMMCVGVFFSTSSLFAPLSIPELLMELTKVSQAIAAVSEEQGHVFCAGPFETLSAALQQLETEKRAGCKLVSYYRVVTATLGALAFNKSYMSQWLAFARLRRDLNKVLKVHGIAYEPPISPYDEVDGVTSEYDVLDGVYAARAVKSCDVRSDSSESYCSTIGFRSAESCIESSGFELELFKEQYEWFHEQLVSIPSETLEHVNFQILYDVLDLAQNDALLDALCRDGGRDELKVPQADIVEKNHMICTALCAIQFLADGDLTSYQHEALQQLEWFARFLNKKIIAFFDCAEEHTAQDCVGEGDAEDESGLFAIDEREKKKKKVGYCLPRPVKKHQRISLKYLKNRK